MLPNIPEMPQHLILAIDRHQRLIEDARRRQLIDVARHQGKVALAISRREARLGWQQRLRVGIGEWLIRVGQRLATEASVSAARSAARKKTAWG